jgi:hypothetical protein
VVILKVSSESKVIFAERFLKISKEKWRLAAIKVSDTGEGYRFGDNEPIRMLELVKVQRRQLLGKRRC